MIGCGKPGTPRCRPDPYRDPPERRSGTTTICGDLGFDHVAIGDDVGRIAFGPDDEPGAAAGHFARPDLHEDGGRLDGRYHLRRKRLVRTGEAGKGRQQDNRTSHVSHRIVLLPEGREMLRFVRASGRETPLPLDDRLSYLDERWIASGGGAVVELRRWTLARIIHKP